MSPWTYLIILTPCLAMLVGKSMHKNDAFFGRRVSQRGKVIVIICQRKTYSINVVDDLDGSITSTYGEGALETRSSKRAPSSLVFIAASYA